ncbi:MAG: diphosphomevalonate decarboxylase [Candidatus Micrarchaeaceae archaeon]
MVKAPSNIAFTKYWGKRDFKINLPNNGSISMTLDENVSTKTAILFSKDFKTDYLYINNEVQDIHSQQIPEKLKFIKQILDEMKQKANLESNVHCLIYSENSFPSSAGIASSASGAIALSFALTNALEFNLKQNEISIIARRISGSGCRSIYGGFVEWKKGINQDGSDSYSIQLKDEKFWPELRDIIVIVDASAKKISSSIGHEATVKTSALYKSRPDFVENEENPKLRNAILGRDFETMAKVIMQDSNSLHAVMLDTWPPIIYLNDSSKEIIYDVLELNNKYNKTIAGYTFDAGPNAHIITTEKYSNEIINIIKNDPNIKLKEIIISKPGTGPKLIKDKEMENKILSIYNDLKSKQKTKER